MNKTIEELKRMQTALQQYILVGIRDFEETYGVSVHNVDLLKRQALGDPYETTASVKVEVKV